MHDVVGLGWRLAGVLKSQYTAEVLASYSDERQASAKQLIDNDKIFSALISRKIPDHLKVPGVEQDPMKLFDDHMTQQSGFTNGLGIWYQSNLLNDAEGAYPPIMVKPGHRAPDVLVHQTGFGSTVPVRLFDVAFKFNGKFRVIVFAGRMPDTALSLKTLRSQVDKAGAKYEHVLDFITLVADYGIGFFEYLGFRQFGKGYWDADHSAHDCYGVSHYQGAIVVIRPDGILGTVASLDDFGKVEKYLAPVVVPRVEKPLATNGHATGKELGEFLTRDENNLVRGNKKQATEFN